MPIAERPTYRLGSRHLHTLVEEWELGRGCGHGIAHSSPLPCFATAKWRRLLGSLVIPPSPAPPLTSPIRISSSSPFSPPPPSPLLLLSHRLAPLPRLPPPKRRDGSLSGRRRWSCESVMWARPIKVAPFCILTHFFCRIAKCQSLIFFSSYARIHGVETFSLFQDVCRQLVNYYEKLASCCLGFFITSVERF